MLNADNIKLIFTYLIATIVIAGGGLMLFAIRLDPPETGSATLSLAIVGFIGGALAFVFNAEAATRATRAAQSSSAAGAASTAAATAAASPTTASTDTTGDLGQVGG